MAKDREAWCFAVHGVSVRHDLVTEQQNVVFSPISLLTPRVLMITIPPLLLRWGGGGGREGVCAVVRCVPSLMLTVMGGGWYVQL